MPEQRSRLRIVDLVQESLAGILQRTGRTALTILGIMIGLAAFVAVLGLTATASGQISKNFTELEATQVTVEDVTISEPYSGSMAFPPDADQRVLSIDGVRHAGVILPIDKRQTGAVTGVPLPGVTVDDQIPVVGTSPGLFDAVRGELREGRTFDSALDTLNARVVLIGGAVARTLGITRLDRPRVIFVGGIPFAVAGIVDSVQRRPELLTQVWVPLHTADVLWPGARDPSQPPTMIIDTRLGAAGVVARQAAIALRPDAVNAFRVSAPPDPHHLRDQVDNTLSGLFLVLAAVSLLVGGVGIANTTLVAVLERVPEIGLRRSLGAQRYHVAAQFLTESSALGGIGGLVGAGVGVTVVVITSAMRHWTPVLEPWTVLCAPLLGALTGLVSGLYPALRASRVEPIEALR